jgi:hypothetical protein
MVKTVVPNYTEKENKMASRYPDINKIFDDLDSYRDFCREFGYVFDEKHLYDPRTSYSQYERYKKGQRITNNWKEDRRTWLANQSNHRH